MDQENKEKVKGIISKEIEIEDDMLDLYTLLLKESDFIKSLSDADQPVVQEIINILLRDTARHKIIMSEVIANL